MGAGVPVDNTEAVKWFKEAARLSLPEAELFLAHKYECGEGVPEDDVMAYAYYSRAAARGNKFALSQKDHIARLMTPDQVAQAQALYSDRDQLLAA